MCTQVEIFCRRFASWRIQYLFQLVVLTKCEKICDKIIANVGAFSHFSLIINYAKRQGLNDQSTMMLAVRLGRSTKPHYKISFRFL